jgi:hypothetical protein
MRPAVLAVAGLLAAVPSARAATFAFTGGEQSYTVPRGVFHVRITAIGAPGGGPPAGLTGGRAATAMATVRVAPRQTLFVEVGGPDGQPAGGFNGGGGGGARTGLSVFGGGGASDVRALPRRLGVLSLLSRRIVAAGGGGSASPAASGGDAGAPGGFNGPPEVAGGAGLRFAGGPGGACDGVPEGCGAPGRFATGGAGGASGAGADTRIGGGGGGGWFGGGGGGAVVTFGVGGGGGGSSLVPPGGTLSLASGSDPGVEIVAVR